MGKLSKCGGPASDRIRASQEQGSGAPDSHLEDASGTNAPRYCGMPRGLTSGLTPMFVTFGLNRQSACRFATRDPFFHSNAFRSSRVSQSRLSAITQEAAGQT